MTERAAHVGEAWTAGAWAGRALRAAALLLALIVPAQADEPWPVRPIRLIVGFAPGGSVDLVARWIAEPLGQALGQPVLVDNRPGAGGNVGMDQLAKAPPDGYTLGLAAVGAMAINPALLGAAMPYDPVRDFTPVTQLVSQPAVLVVHPGVPAQTVPELRAWLRERAGEPYGTAGVGTLSHLTGEMVKRALDVPMEHVPYRGDLPAINELISGQLRVLITNIAPVLPFVRDGRARAIAVSSAGRAGLLPDIATVAEHAAQPVDLVAWQGVYGPARLPEPIIRRLQTEIARALALPAVRQRFEEAGTTPVGSMPEAFAAFTAAEQPKWREVVRVAGIKAE